MLDYTGVNYSKEVRFVFRSPVPRVRDYSDFAMSMTFGKKMFCKEDNIPL